MSEENLFRVRLSLKGRPIKTYTFTKEFVSVGRDPGADIVLDNPGISREHLRFERMPNGHYSVSDQGSANGTYLNDERVQSAFLYNNDVVRIGKFSLWISLERDRRAGEESAARVSADANQGTVMLSTGEIDHLMSAARAQETGPPVASFAPRSPSARAGVDEGRRNRVPMILAIGAALIIATSVGAGAAWLLIK